MNQAPQPEICGATKAYYELVGMSGGHIGEYQCDLPKGHKGMHAHGIYMWTGLHQSDQ